MSEITGAYGETFDILNDALHTEPSAFHISYLHRKRAFVIDECVSGTRDLVHLFLI